MAELKATVGHHPRPTDNRYTDFWCKAAPKWSRAVAKRRN